MTLGLRVKREYSLKSNSVTIRPRKAVSLAATLIA